jgi:hypothetical protein
MIENTIERMKVRKPKKKKIKATKKIKRRHPYLLKTVIRMSPMIAIDPKPINTAKKAVRT